MIRFTKNGILDSMTRSVFLSEKGVKSLTHSQFPKEKNGQEYSQDLEKRGCWAVRGYGVQDSRHHLQSASPERPPKILLCFESLLLIFTFKWPISLVDLKLFLLLFLLLLASLLLLLLLTPSLLPLCLF